jgi:surface polysaccharide O-acyltransferase-like enzyme
VEASDFRPALKQRDPAIDLIKAVAIVMVVLIHCSATYLSLDHSMGTAWSVAIVLNCLSRPCVPWFFMVTGCLVICPKKTEEIGSFYRRRLLRLLVPTVFWSLAYIAWNRYFHGEDSSILEYLKLILGEGAYYHLWFLYVLAGLYLAVPFLSRLIERMPRRDLALFLALWFGGASLLPWLEWALEFKASIPLGWFGSYFGYLVLGYFMRNVHLSNLAKTYCGVILIFACLATIAGTVALSARDQGRSNENLLVYLAPNIVLIAALGFALLKNREWNVGEIGKSYAWSVICFLSKASLGIYLSHLIVLEIAVQVIFRDMGLSGICGLSAIITSCLVITLTLVWLGLKIPVFRRVMG